jgi:hypothetical protein
MMVRRSKEGVAALRGFLKRWKGKSCWNCTTIGSERHHIVYRDGLIYDDQRNLAWLCGGCHSAHHLRGVANYFGRPIAFLTTETILRLKRDVDPDYWDLAFLRLLAGPGDGRLNMEFGRGLE